MSEPFVIEQKQADGSYQQLIPLGYVNRNEFDNSYFVSSQVINQREVSGTISTPGYFIDRWKLVSGTVTLTANGLTLNGTISQILPTAIGTSYSTSVGMYSGTATVTYDNNNATGTITSTGGIIEWVKLEIGATQTPFVPKGYGIEFAECQRYFQRFPVGYPVYGKINTNGQYMPYLTLNPPMRIAPTSSAFISASISVKDVSLTANCSSSLKREPSYVADYTEFAYASYKDNPTFGTLLSEVSYSADL